MIKKTQITIGEFIQVIITSKKGDWKVSFFYTILNFS